MAACIAMNRLPDSAIRLLGSTQVITSVYSVIKELLENSFDAGATSVEIKLENYGLDKIEVRDNGCGIKTADVQVFAKRHFTSKIASHADLEALTTYGFRGEALASLCAVSEVSVTTKTAADDISLTYTLDCEGSIVSTTPSHLGQGTTVCAKNLFKNLPVRKQYHSMVKKKKEDLKNVENLLLSYGVILPKVRFTLRHNKEMIWQKVVLENTAAVLQSILGKGVIGQMEWSQKVVEDLGMTLELCVPKPGSDVSSLSRSACDRSFLCINSRPVAVKEIDKLIRQYYSNCHACEMSRHPVYYLGITLPAKDLDVNIDPNKTTVMTTNMKLLREQLEEMLLCIYGPLDEAPSWRYRDADNGKSKTSASKPDDNNMSTSLLEHLKKTCTDFGDPVTQCSSDCNSNKEKEPKGEQMPAEAVAVVREVTPVQKMPAEENVGRPCGNGRCPDWNQHVHGMDRTEVSLGVNTSMPSGADSKAGPLKIIPGNSSLQEPQGNCSAVMQNVGLASDTSGEVSGTLPHNLPEDVGKNSKESAAPSNNLLPELTVVANKDHCASMCKNEGKGTKGHSGNGFEGPREGLSAAEVKVTGEGEKESRSHSEETQVAGTSGWSHGTSVKSADGATVQPVCLLAPASAKLASKRPLSPSHDQQIQKEMAAPEKRGRRLCPAQSTLYDMINNTAVKRPLTAREFFMKEKRSSVVEQNPQADYDEVTDILAKMWDELAGETRISFLEKCWSDTHRYNKELAAAKTVVGKVKTSAAGRHKPQVSVRDMVAVASTQPSPQPAGKRRVKSSTMATNMPFSMTLLRSSLSLAAPSSQVHFPGVQVLASLPSCKTWVCGRGSELCILNIHRLSEAMVYQRLLSQHCLPVHHCQPVRLTPSNTGGYWSVLQKLAESHLSLDAFSHLSDRRLAANGLDVKCWKDTEGQLCVELVGVCGDVPTYGVDDLVEILELVSNSTSSSLLHSRPLKVLNYLKGEAVRMVRQQAGERSMEEVQDLLEEGARLLPADCSTCLHGRPFFHTLLPDIDTTAASQESTESLPDLADGSERGGRCTSRESLSGNDSLGEGAEKSKEGWEMKWTFGDDSMDQVMSLDDLMDSE